MTVVEPELEVEEPEVEPHAGPALSQQESTEQLLDIATERLEAEVLIALANTADAFSETITAAGEPVDPNDVGRIAELWQQQMLPLLEALGNVYMGTVNAVRRNLGPFVRSVEELRQAYLSSATNRLAQVGDDLWESARETLTEGNLAGEGYDQLRERLRDTFAADGKYLGESRATRIARTEVQSAVNRGTQDAMVTLDSEIRPTYKVWLATYGGRTRPEHARADGQVVPINEAFTVMGEQLQYPGDPVGSAANTINCRCAVVYTDDPNFDVHDPNRESPKTPVIDFCGRMTAADGGDYCEALDGGTSLGDSDETWSPSMSESEAASWAKDSAIKDTMWHGTPTDVSADSIMRSGFDDSQLGTHSGNRGYYGEGMYLTGDRSYAATYAYGGETGQVLGTKVNVRSPWMTEMGSTDADGLWSFAQSADAGGIGTTTLSDAITLEAKRRGHDSVAITKNGSIVELVLFDKRQATVFTKGGPFDG